MTMSIIPFIEIISSYAARTTPIREHGAYPNPGGRRPLHSRSRAFKLDGERSSEERQQTKVRSDERRQNSVYAGKDFRLQRVKLRL